MQTNPNDNDPNQKATNRFSDADFDDTPGFAGTDDEAIRQINRRTTPVGRIVTVLVLVGLIVVGYVWWTSSHAYEARNDWEAAANAAPTEEAMLGVLRDALAQAQYDDVRERILRNLGHFKDAQAVPVITAQLDHAGPVRREAARALARIGSPAADQAKDKLLEVLPKTDLSDHAPVVWALTVLRDARATDAIIDSFTKGQLQEQEGFDPKKVTDVLGPERLASPELLNHPHQAVRLLVALALSEAASPDVVAPLSELLRNELKRPTETQVRSQEKDERKVDEILRTTARSFEVMRAAAVGLGRTGQPSAAAPLFELLQAEPSSRNSVLDSLRRSTSATGLSTLITASTDIALKRELVRALAESHDPRGADALAQLSNDADPDIHATAALGLAELGDTRAIPTLVRIAGDTDDAEAMLALDALRALGSRDAVSGLMGLYDSQPGRKAAILRALGATHDPGVEATLTKELAGDDIGAAAMALADLNSDAAYKKLAAMLPRPANTDMSQPQVQNEELYSNRGAAIAAIGRFGRAGSADALMTIVEDLKDDARLRSRAALSLGQVATGDVFAKVIQKARDMRLDEDTRRFYVQALWQKPVPGIAPQLVEVLTSDAESTIKKAAALALGYSGDPSLDERMSALLDDPNARRYAAFAIVLGGSIPNVQKLIGILAEDRDTADVLQTDFTSKDSDEFSLVLSSHFDSGAAFRRIAAAKVMRDGVGTGEQRQSYGYVWAQLTARLRNGWDGPGGASKRLIRAKLYDALTGSDADQRELAAEALAAMNERGLLLAARDQGQAGAEEARAILRGKEE